MSACPTICQKTFIQQVSASALPPTLTVLQSFIDAINAALGACNYGNTLTLIDPAPGVARYRGVCPAHGDTFIIDLAYNGNFAMNITFGNFLYQQIRTINPASNTDPRGAYYYALGTGLPGFDPYTGVHPTVT